MIHSDSSVLSGSPVHLSPGNQASNNRLVGATPEPTWGAQCTQPDLIKRKRNDSFDPLDNASLSRTSTVDNATNTQNLLAEYLQKAEQQLPENRRPGRKPLHHQDQLDDDDEDPKVKRKVQNRAAQRAFRERKERYVRELEIKIRQIEMNHMQVTSQLAQENQYLRLTVHRLKTELSTIKGIPYESMQDIVPALNDWQQQQFLPTTPVEQLQKPPQQQQLQKSADLAPFLTLSSQSMVQIAPGPTVSAPPRVRTLAPAPRPASEKKRPVPILPQQQQHRSTAEMANPYIGASSSSSSSSSNSVAAMYVRFSPQERAQDNFDVADTLRADAFLTSRPLYEHYRNNNHDNGSSSGSSSSGGGHSPGLKHVDQVEKAATLDDEESATTRMQTVWRRLNLYGRFAEFNFDQLCRVAQIADGNPSLQRAPVDRARTDPSIEDWELDKLMHQMDPDHL